MWDSEIDVDRVRERVKARLQRRRSPFWRSCLTLIIGLMIVSAIVNSIAGTGMGMHVFSNSAPWVIFFLIIIGASMFRRAARSSRAMPTDDEIARAVERELRREQRRVSRQSLGDRWYGYDDADGDYAAYEKPKRSETQPIEKRKNEPAVRLGDDGELIFDNDQQQSQSGHNAL